MEVTLNLVRTLAGGLGKPQVGSFPIFEGRNPTPTSRLTFTHT
jgi:hypothetical protein